MSWKISLSFSFPRHFQNRLTTIQKGKLGHLRSTSLLNTLKGSVTGLEVQVRRPIVGEIFRELASSARSRSSNITRRHRSIEPISSYNLMDVTGWDLAGVDE